MTKRRAWLVRAHGAAPFAAGAALVGAMLGAVMLTADVPHLHHVPRSAVRSTAYGASVPRGAHEPCDVAANESEEDVFRRATEAVRRSYAAVFGSQAYCGVDRAALVSRTDAGLDDVVAALSCSSDEGGWLAGLVLLSGEQGGPLRLMQLEKQVQLVPVRACGGRVRLAPVGPPTAALGGSRVLPWTHVATVSGRRLVLTAERPAPPEPTDDLAMAE